MVRRWLIFVLITSLAGVVSGQGPSSNARSLGMGGAVTSVAEGVHAIGFNPARLAFSRKDFSWKLGGLNLGLTNNLLSATTYNQINGADFIDPADPDYQDKEAFLNSLPEDGFRLITTLYMAPPALSWARGTTAYSSDVVFYGNFGMPRAVLDLLFTGNPIEQELDLELEEELLGAGEWGFSFAVPMENSAFGFTLKYLQGLVYLGIEKDSSGGTIRTDPTGLYGEGRYLLRQAVGGSGFGLDVGFAAEDVSGFDVGISLINTLGRIKWHGTNFTKDLMGGFLQSLLPWGENEYYLYSFKLNGVTALKLLQDIPQDSLFQKEGYTVYMTADSGLVRSEGRNATDFTPDPFVTDYPAVLHMSVSKEVEEVGVFALDLSTGFKNQLWARRGWVASFGMEAYPSKRIPLRMGMRYGGKDDRMLGLGFGVHSGPLQFDMAVSLNNGLWLHTMKGLNLAVGLTLVR